MIKPRIRATTAEDVDEIAVTVTQGFHTFAEFAPDGWELPEPPIALDVFSEQMALEGLWSRVAETEAGVVGHITTVPSALVDWRPIPDDPELCFFWQLYVREAYWGTGLAAELHDLAIADAGSRGFRSMLLTTPQGSDRARRFYERRGWTLAGDPRLSPIGLPVVRYTLDLTNR